MTTGPTSPEQPDRPAEEAAIQPPAEQAPPPPPSYGAPPPGYALQAPMRPDEEKLWAIGAHLGPLVLGFIAPLIVWLVYKDRSPFLNHTAKEALNFQISYAIYGVVASLSIILLVGIVLLPIVGIAWLVFMIIATIKVANFEDYRYPLIFRFVS